MGCAIRQIARQFHRLLRVQVGEGGSFVGDLRVALVPAVIHRFDVAFEGGFRFVLLHRGDLHRLDVCVVHPLPELRDHSRDYPADLSMPIFVLIFILLSEQFPLFLVFHLHSLLLHVEFRGEGGQGEGFRDLGVSGGFDETVEKRLGFVGENVGDLDLPFPLLEEVVGYENGLFEEVVVVAFAAKRFGVHTEGGS